MDEEENEYDEPTGIRKKRFSVKMTTKKMIYIHGDYVAYMKEGFQARRVCTPPTFDASLNLI